MLKCLYCFLANLVRDFLTLIFRPIWKFLCRVFTGKFELERIATNVHLSSHERTSKIESSLQKSKHLKHILQMPVDSIDEAIGEIFRVKISCCNDIDLKTRMDSSALGLKFSLLQILAYERLKVFVEQARCEFYDSKNAQHEAKLLTLWNSTCPDYPLKNRVSLQWVSELGFQGSDPSTDFRGMGLLGLDQLIYFAQSEPEKCRSMRKKSQHPTKGYPFAIVGISMTALSRSLLRENQLKRFFSTGSCMMEKNYHSDGRITIDDSKTGLQVPDLVDFHDLYVALFIAFDQFWYQSNPESIMDFGKINKMFHERVIYQLNNGQFSQQTSVKFRSLVVGGENFGFVSDEK